MTIQPPKIQISNKICFEKIFVRPRNNKLPLKLNKFYLNVSRLDRIGLPEILESECFMHNSI